MKLGLKDRFSIVKGALYLILGILLCIPTSDGPLFELYCTPI